MNISQIDKILDILLVEDNPGDVRLTLGAFKDWKRIYNLSGVENSLKHEYINFGQCVNG